MFYAQSTGTVISGRKKMKKKRQLLKKKLEGNAKCMYPSTVIGVIIPRECPSLLTISLPSVPSLRRDVSALKQVTETDTFGADLELTLIRMRYSNRSQELCESRGGCPAWGPVPNKPGGFCGRKATLKRYSMVA